MTSETAAATSLRVAEKAQVVEQETVREQARKALFDMGVPEGGIDWLPLLLGMEVPEGISFEEGVLAIYQNMMEIVNRELGISNLRDLQRRIQDEGLRSLLFQVVDPADFLRRILMFEGNKVVVRDQTIQLRVPELTYGVVQFTHKRHIAQAVRISEAVGVNSDVVVNLSAGMGEFFRRVIDSSGAKTAVAGCYTVLEAFGTAYQLIEKDSLKWDVTLVDLNKPETFKYLKQRIASLGVRPNEVQVEFVLSGSTSILERVRNKLVAFAADVVWVVRNSKYAMRSNMVNAEADTRITEQNVFNLVAEMVLSVHTRFAEGVHVVHGVFDTKTPKSNRMVVMGAYILQVLKRGEQFTSFVEGLRSFTI
ncbi:MAG: hypothetical protein ABIE03_06920 [Patescibacteria group bacterium]|nr:hypothetical protein [Patescibacteria group bacterium]